MTTPPLPPDILLLAQTLRDRMGPGVKLLYVETPTEVRGRLHWERETDVFGPRAVDKSDDNARK